MNKKELLSRYLLDNASKDNINEQFKASGLDRRALGIINNKDKVNFKKAMEGIVFAMADDGYDEGDIQDFLSLAVRDGVKILYKLAVK